MQHLSLNGSWDLRSDQTGEGPFPAPVPGCAHDALKASGTIPDLFYRFNEAEQLWVGERDWVYERTFEVPGGLLDEAFIRLRCHGLDTLATIELNGREVARTDNMFRTYEWDVKQLLREGENRIRITFATTLPLLHQRSAERHLPAWNELTASWHEPHDEPVRDWGYFGRGYLRKQACQYGWDWGPMTPSAGIWRDIELVAWSTARIEDWRSWQDHHPDGSVTVHVSITPDRPVDLAASVVLEFDGAPVASASAPSFYGEKTFQLHLPEPHLWWPNGLGKQPLYTLKLALQTPDGETLDHVTRRIGLRTLRLLTEPDEWGHSFCFEANGVRFFAKGANWIPVDEYPSAANLDRRYRDLLTSARDAHMNMLRVWGGGYFSQDAFYDLCDELGLCVWQDMMFGCGTYPTWDPEFLENVRREVRDNARRLRHHASLTLWCGNNELEMGFVDEEWSRQKMSWESYEQLFDRLIPAALLEADPGRPYIPGSPHAHPAERKAGNGSKSGDCHFWAVWFSEQPFESYRAQKHRFMSEFGYQSFPEPRTVHAFTEPEDRHFDSGVLTHRQRSQPGNGRILFHTREWFGDGHDFDTTLWLTQLTQANALRIGIEHWRRQWPRTAGATYWQLNDCWPAPTWSSIDVHGRWKALHYFAQRFFEPILVCGLEEPESGRITAFVHNDLPWPIRGTARATVWSSSGDPILTRSWQVLLEPNSVQAVGNVRLPAEHAPEQTLTFLDFEPFADGPQVQPPSENLVLLSRPAALPVESAALTWEIEELDGGRFGIRLTAAKPSLWVWASLRETDCRFTRNFFAMQPGIAYRMEATPAAPLSREAFSEQLEIRSTNDCLLEARRADAG